MKDPTTLVLRFPYNQPHDGIFEAASIGSRDGTEQAAVKVKVDHRAVVGVFAENPRGAVQVDWWRGEGMYNHMVQANVVLEGWGRVAERAVQDLAALLGDAREADMELSVCCCLDHGTAMGDCSMCLVHGEA